VRLLGCNTASLLFIIEQFVNLSVDISHRHVPLHPGTTRTDVDVMYYALYAHLVSGMENTRCAKFHVNDWIHQ